MRFNSLKYAFVFVSFFSIHAKYVKAQSQVKIGLPIEFTSYWSEKSLSAVFEEGNQTKNRKYWNVFSDGLNNKTYKTPDFHHKEVKYNNLKFLQSFVVSEIDSKTKMIHLMEPNESYDNIGFPFLKEGAKDYGWISINNVIPSAYPKKQIKGDNENFQIFTEKALCMHVVNNQDPNASRREVKEMHFYEGTGTNVIAQSPVQGEYPYYVFAKKNGRVLLSERSKLDMSKDLLGQQIAGWIDIEDIQVFTSRLCWEPGWNNAITNEYISEYYQDFTFGVYDNRDVAERVVSEGKNYPSSNRQSFKILADRQNKTFNRMYQQHAPDTDKGVVEVLILGNPNQKADGLKARVKKQRDQLRNMNVLFVIDGSASMQPYFNSAAAAIQKSMQRLEKELANGLVNSLKFAVGVYRDKTEERDGKMYEFKKFTSNSNDIVSFLKNVRCYSNPGDDAPEAVFQGLIKSMENFEKDQKNILIWVGDAGNRRTDAESQKQEIIKLANYYDVNWAVFQIYRTANSTYDYFRNDANAIIIESAKAQLKKMNKTFDPGWNPNDTYTEMELDLFPDNNESEGYIMFASIKTPIDDERRIAENTISNKISDVIINMHDNTVEEIEKTKNYQISVNGGKVDVQSEPMYNWLKRKGYTAAEIEILQEKSFRFKGFLPLRINSVHAEYGKNAQKDVVMLTTTELKQKKDMMAELIEAAEKPSSDRRDALLDVFVRNMYLILGVRQDDKNKELKKQIYQMSFNNLWLSLFGIPFNFNYKLSQTKVSLIADDSEGSQWTDQIVDNFVKELSKSYGALKQIDENYEFVRENGFKTNGGDNFFYYLPRDEYFP